MEDFPSVTVFVISISLVVWLNYMWSGNANSSTKARPPTTPTQVLLLDLPSVGIVGAGAIGTVTGLCLATNPAIQVVLVGQKTLVTTVAANQEQLRYLDKSRKGAPLQLFSARIRNSLPTTRIPVPAGPSTSPYNSDPVVTVTENMHDLIAFHCKVIIVATKATATQSIGESLAQVLPLDSNVTILSFQNGIGNAHVLRTALQHHPNIQVLSTMVNFNASWEYGTNLFFKNTHGTVNMERPSNQSGPGDIRPDDIHERRVHALVAAMAHNHLAAQVVPNIAADLHSKLLINLFNAVNALAGLSTPATLQKTGYRRVWAAAMLEGLAIYRHRGIATSSFWGIPPTVLPWLLQLPVPPGLFRWVLTCLDKMGETSRSSMLQDLERRRTPTEVNYLCGEIVRLGKEIHMAAPVNEALVRLVQAAEVAGTGSPRWTEEHLLVQVGLETKKTTTTGRPNVTDLSHPSTTPQAKPHSY